MTELKILVAPETEETGETGDTGEKATCRSDTEALESRLDSADTELLRLVRERIAMVRALAAHRAANGGIRYVHERELATARRFRELGPLGADLAMVLRRLCG